MLIATEEVEGPVATNNSGNTFNETSDVDLNGSFLGSPLVPPVVGMKSACK